MQKSWPKTSCICKNSNSDLTNETQNDCESFPNISLVAAAWYGYAIVGLLTIGSINAMNFL